MASIKVKYRPPKINGHEGIIYYQIIHRRKPRQLSTGYHIMPQEWDEKRASLTIPRNSERRMKIMSIRENIRHDLERFSRIIKKTEETPWDYDTDDIIDEFKRISKEHTFFNLLGNAIARLRQNGKTRTSETYTAALNSFKKFRNNEDITIDRLDTNEMERYESWQKERGICPNTISFYTRIFRAVYRRAVENGLTDDNNPFRRVYTGVDKTVKRALSIHQLRLIKELNLSRFPALDYARDMFILSFYFRGMSFIDMAFLLKSNLKDGFLTYRRRKTGQQLTIEWTSEMQTILDKYPENESQYLLPIIRKSGTNDRSTYRSIGFKINRNLKQVAAMAGITARLTLYVARHSWASAAQSKGIPISIISEGMGHDNETTTRIYLASLDSAEVDRANAIVMASLRPDS